MNAPLITCTPNGLYCDAGEFYIDPWRPVPKAVITHGHSDHARRGHGAYLCHTLTRPILEQRLGPHAYQCVEWNEPLHINGVEVSLHPAGHVIGSSQIRVRYKDEIWVVSGDYKTENDGLSGAFEPLRCHTFITESTFGLPVYQWQPQAQLYNSLQAWIRRNQADGFTSVLLAYSLGKAQRVLDAAAATGARIFVHGAVAATNDTLQAAGIRLPDYRRWTTETPKEELKGSVVIAPASVLDSPWLRRFQPCRLGVCSGWMQVRGHARRQNVDAGFALSDHADWNGLLQAVKATGASRVLVTHGFTAAFSRYLQEQGWDAQTLQTESGEEHKSEPAA